MSEKLGSVNSLEAPLPGAYILYLTKIDKVPAIGDRAKSASRRNDFIARYRDWRPHWQAEVSTALRGLDVRMAESARLYSLRAAYDNFGEAAKYRADSQEAVIILNEGRINEQPDPDAISNSDDIVRKMAEYLWAVGQLDQLHKKNYQPHRFDGRPNPKREEELDETAEWIKSLSEADLLTLWSLARISEMSRARFWERQVFEARQSKVYAAIQKAIKHFDSEDEEEILKYLGTYTDFIE